MVIAKISCSQTLNVTTEIEKKPVRGAHRHVEQVDSTRTRQDKIRQAIPASLKCNVYDQDKPTWHFYFHIYSSMDLLSKLVRGLNFEKQKKIGIGNGDQIVPLY